MLIDATHAEETRVVVLNGNKVEEFDFEAENKRQLNGNIYLAKVTRVEASLQAAFVEYDGRKHGFLAFQDIHPDYYRIPVADREALKAEELAYAEAQRAREEEEEAGARGRPRKGKSARGAKSPGARRRSRGNGDSESPDAGKAPDSASARKGGDNAEALDTSVPAGDRGGLDDGFAGTVPGIAEGDGAGESVEGASSGEKAKAPSSSRRIGRVFRRSAGSRSKSDTSPNRVASFDSGSVSDGDSEVSRAKSAAGGEGIDEPEGGASDATGDSPGAGRKRSLSSRVAQWAPRFRNRAARAQSRDAVETAAVAPPEGNGREDGNAGDGRNSPDTDAAVEPPVVAGMETIDLDRSEGPGDSPESRDGDISEEANGLGGDGAIRADGENIVAAEAAADDEDGQNKLLRSEFVSDVADEIRPAARSRPRRYRIQEVVKVRQIMLVQVIREPRGNKGAALTTYISLAGRYCVLMPNTARGGGISRKITNASDRKKLREITKAIDVPEGAGLIVRTAGSKRTKSEILRDYEYLQRLWERIRELALKSTAPAKVYEEGDLVKRTIRDLYDREIEEILVEGERGFETARDFMEMILPDQVQAVKRYKGSAPLFARHKVESLLEGMFRPRVNLKSGGYIVIGVTEALVAIDVNSGKSTREKSVEETALKTNLEAADEVARQLRLRDLAGLIVIDFIDMDVRRNNSAVEKRFKEQIRTDRARIQVGRISGFGLLEMSRQRMRPGMIEITTKQCAACQGTGLVRSDESAALAALRDIQDCAGRGRVREVVAQCPPDVANYLFNSKREAIAEIEARFGVPVRVEVNAELAAPEVKAERKNAAKRRIPATRSEAISVDSSIMREVDAEVADKSASAARSPVDAESGSNSNSNSASASASTGEGDVIGSRRGLSGDGDDEQAANGRSEAGETGDGEADGGKPKRRRRRRRKGGPDDATEKSSFATDSSAATDASETGSGGADTSAKPAPGGTGTVESEISVDMAEQAGESDKMPDATRPFASPSSSPSSSPIARRGLSRGDSGAGGEAGSGDGTHGASLGDVESGDDSGSGRGGAVAGASSGTGEIAAPKPASRVIRAPRKGNGDAGSRPGPELDEVAPGRETGAPGRAEGAFANVPEPAPESGIAARAGYSGEVPSALGGGGEQGAAIVDDGRLGRTPEADSGPPPGEKAPQRRGWWST